MATEVPREKLKELMEKTETVFSRTVTAVKAC